MTTTSTHGVPQLCTGCGAYHYLGTACHPVFYGVTMKEPNSNEPIKLYTWREDKPNIEDRADLGLYTSFDSALKDALEWVDGNTARIVVYEVVLTNPRKFAQKFVEET